jgi:hypothetical protein
MRETCLILLSSLLLTGCASTAPRHPAANTHFSNGPTEPLGLFVADGEAMSDDAIQRALDAPLRLPTQARVALFHLGHQSARPWGWGGGLSLDAAGAHPGGTSPKMVGALRKVKGLQDVIPLPDFLLPPKRNFGHIRQAAARVQADLLWLYKTECLLTEDHPLFFKDEVEAICTAEVALVDVRTGLIPFSSKATQKIKRSEAKDELDFARTRLLAERQAVDAAMSENAERLGAFFTKVPVAGSTE